MIDLAMLHIFFIGLVVEGNECRGWSFVFYSTGASNFKELMSRPCGHCSCFEGEKNVKLKNTVRIICFVYGGREILYSRGLDVWYGFLEMESFCAPAPLQRI